MALRFSPRSRAERLIGVGRVVLAASSLVALWRDPSEPAKYATIAYALLAAYLVYALVLAALAWRAISLTPPFGLVTHAFDLAFFSAFMYFTSGTASPFIAYFVFALVCATLRWQWRGTLWTAVVSLGAYFTMGFYFSEVAPDPTFERNEFIIRGFYMAVVAFLLGHLGRHEQKRREELTLMAAWPADQPADATELARGLARHVARILDAPAVALAWTERGRGGVTRLGVWRGGAFAWRPVEGEVDELVEAELAGASFATVGGSDDKREVFVRAGEGLRRWPGDPLAPGPLAGEPGEGLISAPWRGDLARGRVVLFGSREATSDDLLLVEIAAALVGARIDGHLLIESRRAGAAVEERIRLARDLHDGVLQSFTGIGLRVATARRQLERAPEETARGLDELQRLVAAEQRDLRFLIQELKPFGGGEREFDLAARLAELVQRVEAEWGAEVALEMVELEEDLPDETERDLYFIVREAVINAVRHGGAGRVAVRVAVEEGHEVGILVEDDGRGFPFHGRYDQKELEAMRAGPRSLRERIVEKRGSLVLESSAEGARLTIGLRA